MEIKNFVTRIGPALVLCFFFLDPIRAAAQEPSFSYDTTIEVAQPLTPGRRFVLFNQLLFGGKGDPELSIRRTYAPSDVESKIKDWIELNDESNLMRTAEAWRSAKLLVPWSSDNMRSIPEVPYFERIAGDDYIHRFHYIHDYMARNDWIAVELPGDQFDTEPNDNLMSSWSSFASGSTLNDYNVRTGSNGLELVDENREPVPPGVAELLFDLAYIRSSGIALDARIALDIDIDASLKFFVIENIEGPRVGGNAISLPRE